jgi:hypothetical protein
MQHYSALSRSSAAIALVDNLMTLLKEKGLLTEAEAQQIVADAITGTSTAPDPEVHGAADLLRAMYHKP